MFLTLSVKTHNSKDSHVDQPKGLEIVETTTELDSHMNRFVAAIYNSLSYLCSFCLYLLEKSKNMLGAEFARNNSPLIP